VANKCPKVQDSVQDVVRQQAALQHNQAQPLQAPASDHPPLQRNAPKLKRN
jgi:hypothetical protein